MAKFANTKGLSKQEKFMIQGMIVEDNSIEDIAKYLDREIGLVESFIEDITPQEKTVDVEQSASQNPNKMAHVINKTANGNKGIVAMTPAGSQQADSSRNKRGRGIHTAKNAGYTHKIHE